jgi:Protein of unknown function (DUF3365)
MGIKTKLIVIMAVISTGTAIVVHTLIGRSHDELINSEALRIAQIVSTQVVLDRSVYTQEVVAKLSQDGAGADRMSHEKKGFVPLPAQFILSVSEKVAQKSSHLYRYSLISQWNLNKAKGISDDFDRWAWGQLVAQDLAFASVAAPTGGYDWKPIYRVEEKDGRQLLRFMRADPAAVPACVDCHNRFEASPEVIAFRKQQGVEPGKTWQQHRLMGALKVDVPLDAVRALAAEGRHRLLWGIAAVFALCILGLFALLHLSIIRPTERSIEEISDFDKIVDDVVGCTRDLLDGAEAQVRSLQAQSPGSTPPALKQAMENASQAEIAAGYCADLDSRFKALRKRLRTMLGKTETA